MEFFLIALKGISRRFRSYGWKPAWIGFNACPLGDVLESGKGEKGPWLAKFENIETRFPHKILCVVTGKGDAEVFSFVAVD